MEHSRTSLSGASKLTGKSKSTIHNAVKKGIISAAKDNHNRWVIDIAELERVYQIQSSIQQSNEPKTSNLNSIERLELLHKIELLTAENKTLNRSIEELKEDKETLFNIVQENNKLLTHYTQKDSEQSQPENNPIKKRRFWFRSE